MVYLAETFRYGTHLEEKHVHIDEGYVEQGVYGVCNKKIHNQEPNPWLVPTDALYSEHRPYGINGLPFASIKVDEALHDLNPVENEIEGDADEHRPESRARHGALRRV